MPLVVQLADELPQPLRREQADGRAGVVLAEVDGLAGVGVGLAPRLAGLADHDGRQLVAAIAHQRRRLDEHLRPFQRIAIAPSRKRGRRGGDRLAGLLPRRPCDVIAGTFTVATAWVNCSRAAACEKSRIGSLSIGSPSPSPSMAGVSACRLAAWRD